MQAIVRQRHEKGAVSLSEVEEPKMGQNEIRLGIQAAGICGSDVGAYLAKPEYEFLPQSSILGHECAGVVEEVGSNVHGIKVGDRVVFKPGNPCESCYQCRTGEPNNCPNRDPAVAAGGFAPSLVTKPHRVIPVPDGIPIEHAAIVEPLAVTHRAVSQKGGVSPGDTVLVQGPGPMGVFSALIAHSSGAEVILTGLPDDNARLEAISDLPIETETIDPESGTPSPATLSDRYTTRNGFDVAIDATGVGVGINTAIDATRDGGSVVVISIPSHDVSIGMDELVRSEIDLHTSHGSLIKNFYDAIELLQSPNPLPVDSVITQVDPQTPNHAFESFVQAETIKPIFRIDHLETTHN